MTEDADEFLRRVMEEGFIPQTDYLQLSSTNCTPFVGDTIDIHWEGGGALHNVTLMYNERILLSGQPASGKCPLTIGTLEPIRLSAHFGPVTETLNIMPRVIIPRFDRLSIPKRVFVGDDLEIPYRLEGARQIEISVQNGAAGLDDTCVLLADQQHEFRYPVRFAGEYRITLRACSRHASISDLATVMVERTITSEIRKPVIHAFTARSQAKVGDPVRIHWETTYATRLWLEHPDGQQVPIPPNGELEVASPTKAGRCAYALITQNADGEQVSRTLNITWSCPTPQVSLSASRRSIASGERVTLTWKTSGVRQTRLEAKSQSCTQALNIGEANGSLALIPPESTVFRLTGTDFEGQVVEREVQVLVDLVPSYRQIDETLKALHDKINLL